MPSKRIKKHSLSRANVLVDELRKSNSIPHITEAAEAIYSEFGGMRAFARMLKVEYDASPAGGIARQRMLVAILNVTGLVNRKEPDRFQDEYLSDEDLAREIADLNMKVGIET